MNSFKSGFEQWASGFSGCDGGDIGCPNQRSKWICGIEYGSGCDQKELIKYIKGDVSNPPLGFSDWRNNIKYIFNRQTAKLLTAIAGEEVKNYKKFAEEKKLFVSNESSGYFKMNLYPIGP